MKHETKVNDLRTVLVLRNAEEAKKERKASLNQAIDGSSPDQVAKAFASLLAARTEFDAAEKNFAALPKPRRELAAATYDHARNLILSAVRIMGGIYSGDTTMKVSISLTETPSASTHLSYGDKYSRSYRYSRTDAVHQVTLDLDGAVGLANPANASLIGDSANEGLPLIALYRDGRAVWMASKGKRITAESGWIAYNAEARCCYHSPTSLSHAEQGLRRKVGIIRKQQEGVAASHKAQRRIALIARLCNGATATLADAQALGYCAMGIKAFQDRFGIGDTASLPELMKTGDPSAVRLAYHLAKRVGKPTDVHA